MADIDQIIAGGAGSSSRADFSGIGKLPDLYYKAQDQAAKNDLRDAFKDGVPTTPDGQPDFGAMAKVLFQKGALDQGVAASNLGLQQNKLTYGRDVDSQISGGQPQQSTIVSPPSINRSATAVVAPPLARGGAPQAGSPQGDQPGSIVGLVSSAGIPDELAGPVIQQISALTKTDPNASLDPQVSQRVQQVVQAAAQRMKAGQQQQPMGMQPPQGVQQMPPQAQPQPVAPVPQPQPQADPRFVGLVPPNRTPEQQIKLLSSAIASGNLPPEQAKLYQGRIDAITKAAEPTQAEKDFQAAQRNPKLDDYTAQNEAAKASAKGVAEADVKEQTDTIAAGKAASNRLSTLNTISNIISSDKNLTLGFGADTALKVKMALKSIGIDTGDLSGGEAIQKLNALLASESTKAISPRPAQFEFKTFLGNNPGLSLDKQGNERVIGIFSQLAKRDVDLGRLARQNRDNWSNWDSVVESYDKSHPIKDPTSGKVITTDSVVAPGPAKTTAPSGLRTFSSPSEVHAAGLPSGTKFIDNNGKIRVVP